LDASVTVGAYIGGDCLPFNCNDGPTSGQSIEYDQTYSSAAFSGPFTFDSLTWYFAAKYGGNSNMLPGQYTVYLDGVLFGQFSGGGNLNPSFTAHGNPFHYDPAHGDLVLTIIAMNQPYFCNGPTCGNGFEEFDPYDNVPIQDVLMWRVWYSGGNYSAATGGLVTTFSAQTPEPTTAAILVPGMFALGTLFRRMIRR
jgi:hypothetical protein